MDSQKKESIEGSAAVKWVHKFQSTTLRQSNKETGPVFLLLKSHFIVGPPFVFVFFIYVSFPKENPDEFIYVFFQGKYDLIVVCGNDTNFFERVKS